MPPNLNAPAELNALPFETLLGSPLVAVIRAQAASARSSLEFLDSCIDQGTRSVRSVQFSYEKVNERENQTEKHTLQVPILTLVPIPFLRIEEVHVQFDVKLTSTESDKQSGETKGGTTLAAGFGYGFISAKLEASISHTKKTERGIEVKREHSMNVWVKAVQDQMPAGMERVLGILEGCIREAPKASPQIDGGQPETLPTIEPSKDPKSGP